MASLWMLYQKRVEALISSDPEKRPQNNLGRIREKTLALTLIFLSINGVYSGTKSEILDLIPIQNRGFVNGVRKAWGRLEKGSYVTRLGKGYRVVELPHKDTYDGIYHDGVRYGWVPLEPEDLMRLYDPSSN